MSKASEARRAYTLVFVVSILVVEPDPLVAATVALMLEGVGFSATAVHEASLARQALQSSAERFIAVVMATPLPDEDSASLGVHIRDLGLPLVVMSGSDEEMNKAADRGLQLLHKPFRRPALLDALSTAMASRTAGWRTASPRDADLVSVRRWRAKAEELRAASEQMSSPARENLRRLAASYDVMADQREGGAKPESETQSG